MTKANVADPSGAGECQHCLQGFPLLPGARQGIDSPDPDGQYDSRRRVRMI